MTQDEQAILWLAACSGLERRTCVRLLRAAKRPALLLEDFEKFSKIVLKEGQSGLYNSDRSLRIRQTEQAMRRLEAKGRFAVTLVSDDYPLPLKETPDAPLLLYGEGNRALLKERAFCIVGSRITPAWAEKTEQRIAKELSEIFAIVTGFAEGGDSAAIAGAIEGGKLICVLPNGLDGCYPASHASLKKRVKERGLLLSEFPPEEGVNKGAFHARNRILAGLSEGVLVLSAGERSGTLITANDALDYGRDVFALPYSLGERRGAGCNRLIQKGAFLVTDTEDILSVYGLHSIKTERVSLTAEETRVLEVLRTGGTLHAAVIAERADMQIFEAAAVLSSLELKGLAVKAGGNQYNAL